MDSKVSIIVAIYKSEQFLDKLIVSLIKQTYRNIEILLVDDGSPDNSGKICDKYALQDNRILVIHKENSGVCDARNMGLKAATGDYVVIVDGDDWLELDYVEYMMLLIQETKADMALSDKIFTTRDRVQTKQDKIEVWSPEKAACAIIYPHVPIGPWSKIYSTRLLRENNITFCTKWSGEGLYFTAMAAQYSNFVGVGHRKVYNYRLNNLNSGLTHYNLQMGTNALENIKLIKERLHLNTKRLRCACDWHIWKNYGFVLRLIIATNSINENMDLYKKCLKNIHYGFFKVFFFSEWNFAGGIRGRVLMLLDFLFPIKRAKKSLEYAAKALAKDTME